MENKGLLVIIAIVLIGIFSILLVNHFDNDEPGEKIANSISDISDTISDEIKE